MDDNKILEALSMLTEAVKSRMGDKSSSLEGFEPPNDPNNKVKGWSGINLVKGPDDRPKLADKDYVIEKMALGDGDHEMPHDSSGDYARPF